MSLLMCCNVVYILGSYEVFLIKNVQLETLHEEAIKSVLWDILLDNWLGLSKNIKGISRNGKVTLLQYRISKIHDPWLNLGSKVEKTALKDVLRQMRKSEYGLYNSILII